MSELPQRLEAEMDGPRAAAEKLTFEEGVRTCLCRRRERIRAGVALLL